MVTVMSERMQTSRREWRFRRIYGEIAASCQVRRLLPTSDPAGRLHGRGCARRPRGPGARRLDGGRACAAGAEGHRPARHHLVSSRLQFTARGAPATAARSTRRRCTAARRATRRRCSRERTRFACARSAARARSAGYDLRVRVRFPVPELVAGPAVDVGEGAGVPAPNADGVWVPVRRTAPSFASWTARSRHGRRSASPRARPVTSTAPSPTRRTVTQRAVWSAPTRAAADAGVRRRRDEVDVASRPGGLAAGGGAVWRSILQGRSRIDLVTAGDR